MSKGNDILSPEEWIKANDEAVDTSTLTKVQWEAYFVMLEIMQLYAGHVARRVARNVRHRACGVVNRYSPEIAGQREKMVINCMLTDIMQIQLRDVYPEGENKD